MRLDPDHHGLTDEVLRELLRLSETADASPWVSWVEGRDFLGGDSFIQVGPDGSRSTDIYVTRDSLPADAAELDVIAAARTYLPLLVDEVVRLRHRVD
jgi:hypothetical protein